MLSGKVSNLIWLFRKTRFSQPIDQVLHVFWAFENGYPLLGAANAVSRIQAQNLSCFCMSIFQPSQLSVGRGQEGMAILVIGCSADRFTYPVLRIVILSEVIMGYARHQRRKAQCGRR